MKRVKVIAYCDDRVEVDDGQLAKMVAEGLKPHALAVIVENTEVDETHLAKMLEDDVVPDSSSGYSSDVQP